MTTVKTYLTAIGIIMIYSMPIFMMTAIRRYKYLLISLPLCLLLLGCSQSSSTSNTDTQETSQTENVTTQDNKIDKTTVAMQQNDEGTKDEGQSLIAAAKPDENIQRSPMIAERPTDSALQATIIGDYIGMMPCAFCDGVAVTLNLFSDGSVMKTSIYENPESPRAPLTMLGVYRQDENTITIVYQNQSIETYRVQDNHLVMMDDNDTPDADYTLLRK